MDLGDPAPSLNQEVGELFSTLPHEARDDIELALASLETSRAQLQRQDRLERFKACTGDDQHIRLLMKMQGEVQKMLTPTAERELFGFSAAGLTQLRRELRHLRLMARWIPTAWVVRVNSYSDVDELAVLLASLGAIAVKLLILLFIARYVRRHWRQWLLEGQRQVVRRRRRGMKVGALGWAVRWMKSAGPESGWFVALLMLFRWVLETERYLELRTVAGLVLGWAVYRVLVALSLSLANARSDRGASANTPSARAVRAIRVCGLYGLLVWFGYSTLDDFVGAGFLLTMGTRLAGLGAVLVLLWIVAMWQEAILASYLRSHPTGRIARLAESAGQRWVGVPIALLVLFVFVVVDGAHLLGDIAMRFDQTRRALAYLFRRQLERRAEELSVRSDEEDLPDVVLQAFRERPAEPAEFVDVSEALAKLIENVTTSGGGGAALICGEAGAGKTSALRHIRHKLAGEQGAVVTLSARVSSAGELLSQLSTGLGLELGDTVESAADALLARSGTRVVLVDEAERLILRTVGGTGAWVSMCDLVARTSHQLYWVVAVGRFAEVFVSKRERHIDVFDQRVTLRGWSEAHIERLLTVRMERLGVRWICTT